MAWLDIFKAAPVRPASDTPPAPNSTARSGTPRSIVTYDNAMAAEHALSHPFVYFCMTKIAAALSTVDWYATVDPSLPESRQAKKGELERMNALLKSPNLTFSAPQLRYWMAMSHMAFGRVPFKIGIGAENNPNGIYPLAARITKAQTDARGQINQYKYGEMNKEEIYPIRSKAGVGQSYAYEIFTPNLDASLDLTNNVTPLKAVGLPADVMKLLLQRGRDTASGHPNLKWLITSEKQLTAKQQDSLEEFIEDSATGGDNSGNILSMWGTTVQVQKLDNDLSDMHTKLPSDDMARIIARCFGIPLALVGLGAADSSKYANNYDGSRAAFWEDTIIPNYCVPIATGLTEALCSEGMIISFDLDSIPALAYTRALRVKELAAVTFLTVEEKREMAGFDPKVPEGQTLDKPPAPTTPVATPNNGNSNAE